MRCWRAARFAELAEDTPSQVERRENSRRYRAFQRRRIVDERGPNDSQRSIGHALATERASVLDRTAFHAYLVKVRVTGPFALSCAATGFIYWMLGEMEGNMPVADFLTRSEIEERKSFLLGDAAVCADGIPPMPESITEFDTLAEACADNGLSEEDAPPEEEIDAAELLAAVSTPADHEALTADADA